MTRDFELELFAELIKRTRFSLNTEAETKIQMAAVFKANGLSFTTEHVLDAQSRLDFFMDGTAIEVKLKGARMEIYRQCERYLAHPDVTDLILITNRAMCLPERINGKRAIVLNLGRAWL